MATKKPKSTAKVQLDAKTVHKFESHLRDGLVASGVVMATDNKSPDLQSTAKVNLDPDTVARLSEVLRKGLVSSQTVMATDSEQLDKMTKKVKSKPSKSTKKR
jgi:hypothetical protein